MINKKEDLMNTYIENDFGELRKAYIGKAIELGYNHQGNRERGLDWYDLPYIAINDSWDDAYVGQTADATKGLVFSESKLLTLSDLKPRTKTEFVKVGCEWAVWEYLKAFSELSDDVQWFIKVSDDQYTPIHDWFNIAETLRKHNLIYRKVETEIDERQEFIDEAGKYRSLAEMYDSGKFKLVEK